MSAIGAVITEEGDLEEPLTEMVEALDHPNAERVAIQAGGTHREAPSPAKLDLSGIEGSQALVHVQGPAPEPGAQPAFEPDGSVACCIEDSHPTAETDQPPAEAIAHRVAERMGKDPQLGSCLQGLAPDLEVLSPTILSAGEALAALRDLEGAIPLYYGRDGDRAALASRRKPLWRIGLEARRVKPDTLTLLQQGGSQTVHLPRRAQRAEDLGDYLDELDRAVQRRVDGLDRVGLLATHPAAAALVANAAQAEAGVDVHAFVPDRGGGLADAVEDALEDTATTVERVSVTPEALEGRIGALLHALELRHQTLAADAVPAFLAATAAASEEIDVLLADGAADQPQAETAMAVAAGAEGSDAAEAGHLVGEGPLERAHKVARSSGTTLRAPRADSRVHAHPEVPAGMEEGYDPFLERKADEAGLDTAKTASKDIDEGGDLLAILREAVDSVQAPELPDVYDPGESLTQTGGDARPGRAVVETGGPEGLDTRLQWGLDHAALDAEAIGPDERQRLERYLEDVQAYHQFDTA